MLWAGWGPPMVKRKQASADDTESPVSVWDLRDKYHARSAKARAGVPREARFVLQWQLQVRMCARVCVCKKKYE